MTTKTHHSGPWTRRSRRIAYQNPWVVVWHDGGEADAVRHQGRAPPGMTAAAPAALGRGRWWTEVRRLV